MSEPTACYKFQLLPTDGKNKFLLKPIFKVGNNKYLNEFFTVNTPLVFRRLKPQGILDDYVMFSFKYGDDSFINRLITFDTGMVIYPFGVINIAECEDCILGKELEQNVFEFYVFEGGYNYTTIYLSMLVNGLLSNDINQLISRIN